MRMVEAPEYQVDRLVAVDPKTTALIVVDMQNDFVQPGGALAVQQARETIPAIQRLLTLARRTGVAVFYTQDTHDPGDPEFPIFRKAANDEAKGQHVLRGSRGWQIVADLTPQSGERVLQKLRYDGFFGTSLDHELRSKNIMTVIVCGTVAISACFTPPGARHCAAIRLSSRLTRSRRSRHSISR